MESRVILMGASRSLHKNVGNKRWACQATRLAPEIALSGMYYFYTMLVSRWPSKTFAAKLT